MRGIVRALTTAMLFCALAAPCLGEEIAFGGRGEDVLREAVALEDGMFAVGKTASTDGDLSARTRSGETGWAIRIGGDGQRMWDFCSAKSGMFEMIAPHAYADGRFSCVLTDETRQRGEWLVLSDRGRQEIRVAIPAVERLCPQGKAARIVQMTPAYGSTGPYLVLLLEHATGGEMCAAALFPDGGVRTCGEFFGDTQGTVLAAQDGGVVYFGADLGALSVTRLSPGVMPDTKAVTLEGEGVGLASVADALIGGDDSMLVSGRTVTADQKSEAVLLRLNAEGETLFLRSFGEDEHLSLLAETDTGYAVLADGGALFLDEDGVLQGEAAVSGEVLDLLPAVGGALTLTHDPERSRRQAVFTHIAPLHAAEPADEPENTTAPFPENTPLPPADTNGDIALEEGYLRCVDGGYSGVTVSRIDGQGNTLWQTRTPIHTAADRLVWQTAQITEDGDIVLSGYYETRTKEGSVREGASATLSGDGVLREIGLMQ